MIENSALGLAAWMLQLWRLYGWGKGGLFGCKFFCKCAQLHTQQYITALVSCKMPDHPVADEQTASGLQEQEVFAAADN